MQAFKSLSFHQLIGKPLDLLYSRLGGLNGRFFPAGWGNLAIVDLREDIELIKQPQDMKIEWKLLQRGSQDGVPFMLYEGIYRTPCVSRIYDALPHESRTGRVQLLCPDGPPAPSTQAAGQRQPPPPQQQPQLFSYQAPAAVLHLAATGDHGFSRRLRLGGPLLQQGVCQLVHESPYYGARRPPEQRGSKLCAVSDLLALGWATIYESLCLLHWLEQQGVQHRGICGLSMGGVHASMTAGLYQQPLAVTPLLTPRSAAVAYCDGALAPLMSWGSLLAERDGADNEVEQVVAKAAQPVSLLQQARYVVLHNLEHHLEQQMDLIDASRGLQQQQQQGAQQVQQQGAGGTAAWQQPWQQQQEVVEQQQAAADEAVAAMQQAAALAAATEAAVAEQEAADEQQEQQQVRRSATAAAAAELHNTVAAVMAAAQADAATGDYLAAAAASGSIRDGNDKTAHRPPSYSDFQWQQQQQYEEQPNLPLAGDDSSSSSNDNDGADWKRQVWRPHAAAAAVVKTGGSGAEQPPAETFRRLRHVLETYTDVTRYPPPVRPDAAVLVAARHDGYVDMASVKALQAHWPGSELRVVEGGHVSAFLLHQDTFRAAVRDSLAKLAAGPPTHQQEQQGRQQNHQ